jgi:outer membrane protein OmpA-like peptidoglycan-associated protein
MSPVILRGVLGSCLTLGAADLAWLDVNAARLAGSASSAPADRIEPSAVAGRIERLAPLPPHGPISDDAPLPALAPSAERDRPPTPLPAESQTIYFDRGIAFVSEDQAATLISIADVLKNNPKAVVRVEGHADRTGWSDNTGSNLALSDARAAAIVRALGKLGIPRERIRATAFGDTRPVDDRPTEEAYRRNRRAEIRVDHAGGK